MRETLVKMTKYLRDYSYSTTSFDASKWWNCLFLAWIPPAVIVWEAERNVCYAQLAHQFPTSDDWIEISWPL